MKFSNNQLIQYLTKNNSNSVYLNSLNISELSLTYSFDKIEFLSLKHNCIKSINFLQCLPNLFSLDLSDNPIENYDILHSYNSYGYFAITPPENYMEKQILSIKKLNAVIADIPIKDENIKSLFIENNPNIMIFNNMFLSFSYKISLLNKDSRNKDLNNFDSFSQGNSDFSTLFLSSNGKKNRHSVLYKNIKNIENKGQINSALLKEKFRPTNLFNKNNKIINLISQLELYNENAFNIYQLCNKGNLWNNEEYLTLERNNLILISNYYQYHLSFSKDRNNVFSFFKVSHIYSQLLILSILSLYLLGVISKEFCHIFLFNIYKDKIASEEKDDSINKNIDILLNDEMIYTICFYFEIYNLFSENCKKAKNANSIIDQTCINQKENVNLSKIIYSLKEVINHRKEADKLFNDRQQISVKTKMIYIKITNFLYKLNMINEIASIVQLIDDYIIYHKYLNLFAKKNSKDIELFLEIKTILFTYIHKDESFCDYVFNNHQYKNLLNKYYYNTEEYLKNTRSNNVLLYTTKRCNFSLYDKIRNRNYLSAIFSGKDKQAIKQFDKINTALLKNIKIQKERCINNSSIHNEEDEDYLNFKLKAKNNILSKETFKMINKEKTMYQKIYLSHSMEDIFKNHKPVFPYRQPKLLLNQRPRKKMNNYSNNEDIKLKGLLTCTKKTFSDMKLFDRRLLNRLSVNINSTNDSV